MKASDFLNTAETLLATGRGRPLETDLRRSVSTAYYAVFHCMAGCCADLPVGRGNARRTEAWRRTYRALSHRQAREACGRERELAALTPPLRDFARLFVELQVERHGADYDPAWIGLKQDIADRIANARTVIERFEAAPVSERKLFAARILFRERSA